MAASPAKFYFGFLIVSIILWIIFILCYRLFTWMVSRVLRASVGFRVGGWLCLLDIVVKFEKGAIELVSASEIKLGFGFLSGEPKMQVLICDLEVAMRSSASLFCDKLTLSSQFGYERALGMIIRNVEIVSGDLIMNLDEDLFLESKLSSASVEDEVGMSTTTASSAKKPQQEHQLLATLAKYSSSFPEKVSFRLPNLDIRCVNREHDLIVENKLTGIQLRSVKSKYVEDTSESTRLDVQMELSEIHVFREAESSMLEIMKVDVVSSIEIPIQPVLPIGADVEIKLGGTRCNLFISRLEPLLRFHSLEKRKPVLQEETRTLEKSKADDMKTIMWRGTFSAPEMIVMLYGFDDLPVYHFCSQSSHVFATNISSIGTAIDVELGELNLHLADEDQECFKDNIFGTEPNSGLLMHIAKISLDWGRRDCRSKLVLSVDVTTMDISLSFKCVESLITNAMSFKALFKKLSVAGERTNKTGGVQSNSSDKGTRLVNLNLDRCCVNFCDNIIIYDPKSDNYGTGSTSSILSTASDECKRLKYSVSLEVTQFNFSLNKDKHSTEIEVSRAESIYQVHKPCSKVTLFDTHSAKLTRQSGGLNICYLLSATDISLGWEPNVHLSFPELFLRLRCLVYAQRLQEHECGSDSVDEEKRKESKFLIDVEMLMISAKVGDGVEVKFEARSIFSENACIGVLLEGLMLAFNGSRVFKTTRMQISKIPTASSDLSDAIHGMTSCPWDWVVQGSDVQICMPYRLQLCALADSVEEMLRGLRLITVAKKESIVPGKRESLEPEKSSPNFGRIRFCIRKLTAYIEEEPIQGWFDEHYQLVKKEACELAVRLRFLEDFIHKASQSPKGSETSDSSYERNMFFDGVEIDVHDPLAISIVKEEVYKRSFRSYYQACHGLVPSESSGSCSEGFQAGFRPSAARTSLLSVCAMDFDLSLMAVHGGDDAGLMEVLKKLDPICDEISGSNVMLKTGSLVVKLRNYTLPLFSGISSKCEGRIVTFPIAQKVTSFQPQISVGSGTTPPMKTYTDLRVYFEQGEVSFGVGYEPAFADISYAFTVALSHRNQSVTQVAKEEQSLPWWDNMRNYFHGNISLSFSESKWNILATTDPYESQDKLQIVTGPLGFQQSDGGVFVNAEDFKIKLSSLESLISRHTLKVHVGNSRAAFFEAPVFNLEVKMDWDCENSLNVLDPFRSTSLSLQCSFSFTHEDKHESVSPPSPTMNLGDHDLAWILKLCGIYCDPPHKLRSFSIWPRFGVPRVAAMLENLSLDQVMTEFMLRVDATTFLIKYMACDSDDPAKGLTFNTTKLKYELCYSRGKQKYTYECERDALDLVYQGLDLHIPKAFIRKDEHKHRDEGFLLSCDSFTMRRQAPNADPERLLAWQNAGRRNLETTNVRSEFENGSESDDDGYNVVLPDNCQRVFVYGLKLLWTIENREAVSSFVGGMSETFETPKPSSSRQGKIHEETQKDQEEISSSSSSHGENQKVVEEVETSGSAEEGTIHFMVNVIEPQFNLHSEEANGRFLLAAVSGRILARSFQSIIRVGEEVIEKALGTESVQIPECIPEMTWTRMEFSVILEHVQAHVAPTDVDPGAGLQWLPKIRRNSTKVKRTGASLERVFMPCDMCVRYTRHKGVTPDLKVRPLEELNFNSNNITATMTSRQFQVLLDVLTNLLFARLSKPQKSGLQCPIEDDDVEEEADEVIPYGIEEVEFAKINLEEKEREQKLLLDDIRKLSHCSDNMEDTHMDREGDLWMISTNRSILVQGLKKELLYAQKCRKMAFASLRTALQKAAQLQLMEKDKNKSASYATRISLKLNKVVWSMILDGRSFAEVEINDMIFDFDRDYKDIGVARFTTKCFVVRNCMPIAKSDVLLSAWNPPPEWGKKVMLRVDAKQGAPKDGIYPLELFQVEIYPLIIYLTETMYRIMWDYFFPEENHDSQRRQEVWKISTIAGSKRVNKGLASHESSGTTSHSIKDVESSQKSKKVNIGGSAQELRRTSSFDRTWEENLAESVANELVLQSHSHAVSSSNDQPGDSSKQKLKKRKSVKFDLSSHEEKKAGKAQEEMMEFHNIKISQVELLVTYEGSRFAINDLKLLMDAFVRVEFTGTWRRLFSHVKKHITCGVLKSVTGLQKKKFRDKYQDKSQNNRESTNDDDLNLSDDDETWVKHQSDGAGDGFVTSIRGLFNTQRRKAKVYVLRTMRGEAENDFSGEWSDSDVECSPFARQLTITKAKRLIRRHTKKSGRSSQRGSTSQQRESLTLSLRETTAPESADSSGSSSYEEFHG